MSQQNAAAGPESGDERPGVAAPAILRAAAELFARKGFDAVPLSAIAEQAGISKGNIFHHFGCKQTLYLEVMREACSRTSELLNNMTTGRGSFPDRIRHFVQAHLRQLMKHPEHARLIQRELVLGDAARARTLVEEIFGANFSKLVRIFEAGQAQGEVRRELDPAALAFAVLAGNVFFFQMQSVLPHLPGAEAIQDAEVYSAMITDVFLNGVLQPAGSAA